ncbi:hypothetical protein F7Y47_24240 [Vibrio sp. 1-2-3a]|nr:hypothetical protein [Vibrio sp. 2-1-2a]MDU9605445.1 hypothetical protein [Vibrio sp. 1-2-3a]
MHNKAFKSDSQRLAVSLRSSIAKCRSHLNAALAVHGGKSVWNMTNRDVFSTSLKIRFAVSRC